MHDCVMKAVARLLETGLESTDSLKGCSEGEISSLESHFRVQLPLSYRAFLLTMGLGAGEFMAGTDYTVEKLYRFRAGAEQLMKQHCTVFELPTSAFVFASHQGYTYLFFDTLSGDDPPVYMYTEREAIPTRISDTFSKWLESAVEDDIEACGASRDL